MSSNRFAYDQVLGFRPLGAGKQDCSNKRAQERQIGGVTTRDSRVQQQRVVSEGGAVRDLTASVDVQAHLFAALLKCRLVPEGSTWSQLNYSRCGRTDKGVSALGQVSTRQRFR